MKIKDNPYLDQLIRDCEELINNLDDWVNTDDKLMIEKTIQNIEFDIERAENYG